MAKDGFWNKPEETKSILKERRVLTDRIEAFARLSADLEEGGLLLELALEEEDAATGREAEKQLADLAKRIDKFALDLMLDGKEDPNDAILSINAGAGGTEAQDWAEMLFRMYARYIDRMGFNTEIIDFLPGEEAGLKSVTFTADGRYAYGYLKTETGVHRLVRISPFNASGKRHTSFASVFVYPDVSSDIVVEVEDKDLRVDVFRASGAGGQHVNKTSSAVRITHLPTGVVVSCQNEKSQLQNKESALRILRARLLAIAEEQAAQEASDARRSQVRTVDRSERIRTYNFPENRINDHRVGFKAHNLDQVLDGDLDAIVDACTAADRETRLSSES